MANERVESIAAFDQGFYDCTGFSRPQLERYFLHWDDTSNPPERTRAFFAFDLSRLALGADDIVLSSALSIYLPRDGYIGPNPFERVALSAVPSDLMDRVLAGGNQGVELFDSLAVGGTLGDLRVGKEQEESAVVIPMTEAMKFVIDGVLRRTDKRLLIGGRLEPLGPSSGNRAIFRLTDEGDVVSLNIKIQEF